MKNQKKPAVFLDRDGVIIKDAGYLHEVKNVEFIPGALSSIKLLNKHNYLVIVVSNQSGVARGYFNEDDVIKVNNFIARTANKHFATIHGFYYCPHHPKEGVGLYNKNCECRKPKPGMIYKAVNYHNINLQKSILIGDKITDLQVAKNVGVPAYLVSTGYGKMYYDIINKDLGFNFKNWKYVNSIAEAVKMELAL